MPRPFSTRQGAKAPERFTTKFLKDLNFSSSNRRANIQGAEQRVDLEAHRFTLRRGELVRLSVGDRRHAGGRCPLMGHTNADVTINVYTQVLDASLRTAVERIGGELFTIVHETKTGSERSR